MENQQRKFETIRKLQGEVCSSCGSSRYQLVLRMKEPPLGELLARCTQCRRVRKIDEQVGRMLRM
jgi:hypothetical protein